MARQRASRHAPQPPPLPPSLAGPTLALADLERMARYAAVALRQLQQAAQPAAVPPPPIPPPTPAAARPPVPVPFPTPAPRPMPVPPTTLRQPQPAAPTAPAPTPPRSAPPPPAGQGAGQAAGAALSTLAGVGATLGAGPVAGLASAAASAAMGNLAGAAVGATAALAGMAQAGAPDAWQTMKDSFGLLVATIGKELAPTLLRLARAAQYAAKRWEESGAGDFLRGFMGGLSNSGTTGGITPGGWRHMRDVMLEQEDFGDVMQSQRRTSRTMGPEQYMDQLLTAGLQQGDLQTSILRQNLEALNRAATGIDKLVENTARRFGLDGRPFG